MRNLHLTEEQLQAIKKRIGGTVRENRIALPQEKRPAGLKYGNKRTEVHGIKFHSKREAERYEHLRLLERAGEISDLRRQVGFDLSVNGMKICRYICDFTFDQNGARVVEDVKGYATALYQIKRKLMKAVLGIEVIET